MVGGRDRSSSGACVGVRFLADMGISPKVVAFLTELGHNAVHLHEQGLDRLPDSAVLRKARDETRILLTHDLDFGELVAASGERLQSVVVFRLRNMHPNWVSRYLKSVIIEYGDSLEESFIVSVAEGQIRSRILPIQKN